jgi:hypothetical protein
MRLAGLTMFGTAFCRRMRGLVIGLQRVAEIFGGFAILIMGICHNDRDIREMRSEWVRDVVDGRNISG